MQHLRVFGCVALALIPKEKREKWDSKTEKLIFVGYNGNTKGYRLINPKTGKVTNARDVIFLEDKFLGNLTKNKERENTAAPTLEIKLRDTNKSIERRESKQINPDSEESTDEDSEKEEEELLDLEETEHLLDKNKTRKLPEIETMLATPRRTNRERKPVERKDYITYLAVEGEKGDPISIEEAMSGPQKEDWIRAMNRELQSLEDNDTWKISDIPKGATCLGTKWVYTQKLNDQGKPKFKARLVIQGCRQIEGVNYEETFAPVARYSSIRYLLALAVQKGLYISHLDVETAYLYSDLEEDIYIHPPKTPGNRKYSEKVLKLKKAVYGLKQSGRNWNIKLDTELKKEGLERLKSDPCIYINQKQKKTLIVAVYVDDLLIFSKDKEEIKSLEERLKKQFKIRNLGEVSEFLGMKIERDYKQGTLSIHQKPYILRMLDRFRMSDCHPVKTPMELNSVKVLKSIDNNNCKEEIDMENVPFLEAIGSLLYISQISRPDIAYTINVLSSYCKNPKKQHWLAVKRVMRFLKGTIDYKLTYKKKLCHKLKGYSDADWANDPNDRRSITGCVFTKCGGAISWFSKKQRTVALSTLESEYIALSFTSQEAIWLRELEKELERANKGETICINCDSLGAIASAKNHITSQRTKHIDVRHHFIREKISDKIIDLNYLQTSEMLADIFTKALTHSKHIELSCHLGLS